MNKHWNGWWLALSLLCGTVHAGSGGLRIVTAEYAPFVQRTQAQPDGFCIAVVRELQTRIGNRSEIEVYPWARAYMLAGTGAGFLLVCPERTLWRESYLKWVGPLYVSRTRVYARSSAPPQIRSLDDVDRLPGVLVARNSHAMEFLSGIGFQHVEPVNSAQTMLRMLMAGRRPAMLLEERQFVALMRDEGVPADAVVPIYTALTAASYLGFSAQTSEDEVHKWERALAAMKADGAFGRLYKKWFGALPPSELTR